MLSQSPTPDARPSDPGSLAAPPARPARRAASWSVRGAAALLLASCAGVLAVAVWVKPDPRGFGTHEQLFHGPCGMLLVSGYPCPTCGMTTAFSHTVRGQWWSAIRVQPAGFLFCLATAALGVISAMTIVRGRWPDLGLWRWPPLTLIVAFLVVFFGAWAYKVAAGIADGTLPYRG